MTLERSDLTPGYLPRAAFRQDQPTNIAELALGSSGELISPVNAPLDAKRDTLALVRVHGDPIGVVHLPAGAAPTGVELARSLDAQLGDGLDGHVRRYGCAPLPGPDAPLDAVGAGESCVARTPRYRSTDLAVIIPTTRGGELLRACLRSFVDSGQGELEVIVVDNAPHSGRTEPIVAELSATMPGLRYVAEPRPGSSVARNRGIREARAEYLLFTDDDVIVDSGWTRWLIDPFDDPKVLGATGLVLPLQLDTPAQKLFELYAGFAKGVERAVYDNARYRAADRVLYPYWGGVFGSGNSMAFRRAALLELDGFDPRLGAGSPALAGADIELFSRLIASGGRLIYEPRSLCWHVHRTEVSAFERQLFNYGAGLTAIFTKSLIEDPGFLKAAARSVPLVYGRIRAREADADSTDVLPERFARLQRKGMWRGPLLYARSHRWATRLGLDDVLRR